MTETQYPTDEELEGLEDMAEIQYPTDEELEDMYKEFTRSYPEHSWIYPF